MENEDNSKPLQMKKIHTNMSQESQMSFEENPKNDSVSTELCLFDKTWSCRKSNYLTEQSRKIEMEDDMKQEQIGSNDVVTLAPRNEESTEQTRRMENDMDSEQHQMGLSIMKKTPIKHGICLSMNKTYFDAYILRYLSEDDQKKIKLGYGVRVNLYDDESQTTHKKVLMRQSWSWKHRYYLSGTCLKRFCPEERFESRRQDRTFLGLFSLYASFPCAFS